MTELDNRKSCIKTERVTDVENVVPQKGRV